MNYKQYVQSEQTNNIGISYLNIYIEFAIKKLKKYLNKTNRLTL